MLATRPSLNGTAGGPLSQAWTSGRLASPGPLPSVGCARRTGTAARSARMGWSRRPAGPARRPRLATLSCRSPVQPSSQPTRFGAKVHRLCGGARHVQSRHISSLGGRGDVSNRSTKALQGRTVPSCGAMSREPKLHPLRLSPCPQGWPAFGMSLAKNGAEGRPRTIPCPGGKAADLLGCADGTPRSPLTSLDLG